MRPPSGEPKAGSERKTHCNPVPMKTLADLLLLGDPRLYEACAPVLESELPLVAGWVADLHDVMAEIRATYHFGRGIAAPQIGVMKRLV